MDAISVGSIVKIDNADAVVLEITSPLGFRQFRVMYLHNGITRTVNRLAIEAPTSSVNIHDELASPFDDELEPEAESENIQPPDRFAAASDQAIKDLAAARLSKSTQRQTKWAVHTFQGKRGHNVRLFTNLC